MIIFVFFRIFTFVNCARRCESHGAAQRAIKKFFFSVRALHSFLPLRHLTSTYNFLNFNIHASSPFSSTFQASARIKYTMQVLARFLFKHPRLLSPSSSPSKSLYIAALLSLGTLNSIVVYFVYMYFDSQTNQYFFFSQDFTLSENGGEGRGMGTR